MSASAPFRFEPLSIRAFRAGVIATPSGGATVDAGRLAVTIVLTVAALIAGIAVALGREWANRRCSLIERGVAFAGSEANASEGAAGSWDDSTAEEGDDEEEEEDEGSAAEGS